MTSDATTEAALVADALRRAVRAAITAPSVHNTQPWRFCIDGPALHVFADRSRQLPALDPTGRLLFVSCGCAVAMALARLRADGWSEQVTLLPGSDADLVATIRVTGREVGEPDGALRALGDAIERRHSQRQPFVESDLPGHVVARLVDTARAEGGWFRPLRDDDEQLLFSGLLEQADAQQRGNPDYLHELRDWLRTAPAADGVPQATLPTQDLRRGGVLLREFDPHSPAAARRSQQEATRRAAGPPKRPHDQPPARPRRAVVALLGTDRDRPVDWVTAGRVLGAVLLVLTVEGLQASVLGQVVDEPDSRRQLRAGLGLRGPVQVALQIGRGPAPVVTPRRPVGAVLTVLREDAHGA